MKYFLYYGTEENAYEIEKFAYNNFDQAFADVEDTLEGTDEEVDKEEFKKEVEKDGYAIVETENAHSYHIVVGIATYGHCNEISGLLRDYRRNFMSW